MFKVIPAAALVLCTAAAFVNAQAQAPKPPAADKEQERPAPADGKNVPAKPADDTGTTQDRETQAVLDKRLPEVTFDGVGFSDVIDFLRDVTNANVFVNWRALEAAGIDRNAQVSLRLRQVAFGKALELILEGVGGAKVPLAYTVDRGVITISTASPSAHARAYDVRDILEATAATARGADEAKRLATLKKLVTGSVAPDSWRPGSLRTKAGEGNLVVTQTPANHDAVANLLAQTRALLGLPPKEGPAPIVPDPKQ